MNKEPRLRFTDEERADPALEKHERRKEILDPIDTIREYQERRTTLNAEIDKVLAELEALPGRTDQAAFRLQQREE